MFGRKVTLNIDGNGESHKTKIGALVSIVVYVIYFIYMHKTVSKIWNGSSTNLKVNTFHDRVRFLDYGNEDLQQFYIISKRSGESPVDFNELNKHITLEYV